MKAITLTQPWATLVAIEAKKIETRSWATSYRGPLAIHAGKGLGPVGGRRGLYDLCYSAPFLSVLEPAMTGERDIAGFKIPHVDPGMLPLGAIVATCELVDCLSTNGVYGAGNAEWLYKLSDQECAFGDYTANRYGWILRNVQALPEPIPAKGALSLWEWNQ